MVGGEKGGAEEERVAGLSRGPISGTGMVVLGPCELSWRSPRGKVCLCVVSRGVVGRSNFDLNNCSLSSSRT